MSVKQIRISCLTVVLGLFLITMGSSCSAPIKNDSARSSRENVLKLVLVKDADDPDSANWSVDGMVGSHAYKFILDTGAGTTTMTSDKYLSTFPAVGSKDSAGAFNKAKYDLVTAPSLVAGPLAKTNIIIALSRNSDGSTRNVLGMNFFKDDAFHFIFEQNEVVVVSGSSIPNIEKLDLFLGEKSHPYVDLKWENSIVARGVWDTGAGMTVFDSAFIKKHSKLFRHVGSSMGTDSTGAKQETPIYEMREFVLGGKKFPTARVVGVDLSVPNSTIKTPMDFILGYNILRKANWFFDFRSHQWAITKILP